MQGIDKPIVLDKFQAGVQVIRHCFESSDVNLLVSSFRNTLLEDSAFVMNSYGNYWILWCIEKYFVLYSSNIRIMQLL